MCVYVPGGGGGCLRHVQNLTLSQFVSWLKSHPVPIFKLTPNLIYWFMVQLLPICFMFYGTPRYGSAPGGVRLLHWTVICQNMQTGCSNHCPCMYSIGQIHAFEHNILLTKMTPFNIQSGIKRPLNIPRKYSFGQKHRPTLEYTVLPKLYQLCISDDTVKCSGLVGFC